MRKRLLMLCLVSFSLICLVLSERAECKLINLYYSYIDPASTRPHIYTYPFVNPPWHQVDDQVAVGVLANQTIWWGRENWHNAANTTNWCLLLKGSSAYKFDYVPGERAYNIGIPPTTNPPYTWHLLRQNTQGGYLFHWVIKPQPDWQVGVLKKFGKKAGDDADSILVVSQSICCSTRVSGSSVAIANSWFGLAGMDSLKVTEIIVFPDDVPIDTMGTHVFNAPGTWVREFVALDPDDQPRPLGGVKWTSEDGIGLEAGVVFSLGLEMTAAASSSYSLYAFDSESGVYYHFIILTEPEAIPTLTEWGMIIFVVLLAGWMTFVVVRRWKASHATA